MKIRKLTLILSAILAITLAVSAFYAMRHIILNKIRLYVIERIESSTGLGIKIESVRFAPLKGFCLAGITCYKNNLYEEKLFSAPHIFVKFSHIKLLLKKTFSPTISIYDLKGTAVSASGVLGLEIKTDIKIQRAEDALKAIKNIWFYNLSVKSAYLDMKNLTGTLVLLPHSIKSSGIDFVLNGEKCRLDFKAEEPLGDLAAEFNLSSENTNLNANVKKENEIYKISELRGKFFNSDFDFAGELSPGNANSESPVLSLYGTANIDIKDAVRFANPDLKGTLERLNPSGIMANSVYFKAEMRNMQNYELGIKSNAKSLEIGGARLSDMRVDTRIQNGIAKIPIFTAYLYGGALVGSLSFNLSDKRIPCEISSKLSDIKIAALLENTGLKDKGIRGDLFIEFIVAGEAKNLATMKGPGKITVKNANLGPMPLLTPLLGHIYGYFQHVFPELKRVNIKAGSADFYIATRRLMTNNLTLTGDAVGINAKGYIDFDRNLDFEVENQILAQEILEENGWQANLQSIIVQFGKMISKARLTGSLQNPKWKFEYFGGAQNIFKGGLKNILKDILE